MKKQTLHDIAKFCAGLILGDFLAGCWFGSQGLLPMNFFGVTVTSSLLMPWLIFDAALFIILIHYGWHIGKIPVARERTYLKIAGTIFGIVTILHLTRLFFGNINVIIFGWNVPLWLSWIGVILAGYLSYMSFTISKKIGTR